MPIIVHPQTREPSHVDPVIFINRVPSRRESEAAFAKIVAALDFSAADRLGEEIELLRGFICSR